ncbi:MAG: endo alpha-1,4 polygalactosaminidase [Actinomycetota bacterium]
MRRLSLVLALASACLVVPASVSGAAGAHRSEPIAVGGLARGVDLPAPVPCPGCYAPDDLEVRWQWQLQGELKIDEFIDDHDVELFDVDMFETSAEQVAQIHDGGAAAICYISAGAYENFRPDKGRFPKRVLGDPLDGWPGERWLDIRRIKVLKPIMQDRLDRCATKGFDAVEFDNVDSYTNPTGFPLTGADQLRYNVMLANEAHRRKLAAVLKNDIKQIPKMLDYFDMALNEQCYQYRECGNYDLFVDADKAVLGVEYELAPAKFCPKANASGYNWLKKAYALKAVPFLDCHAWAA